MKFSKTTGCFYPQGIEYNDLPDDLIEVTQEEFDTAMARQPGDTLDVIGGHIVVVPKPLLAPDEVKTKLVRQIDLAADMARLTIAGDPLRVVEYERAALEAQAYKAAGYIGSVPPAVKSWADAKGWSGQQAADNILAEAAAWNQALYGIRDMRLKGKETVRNAVDEAAAQAAAEAIIAQIRTMASVGNAR